MIVKYFFTQAYLKTYLALYEELEKGMEKQTENGRPRSLPLVDELFMVLMRLRLGLLLEDLSDRFNISTCSAISFVFTDVTRKYTNTHNALGAAILIPKLSVSTSCQISPNL